MYVCSVACHATNTSFAKTSQKLRVEKYFNNTLYDTIRMEWFSLGIKLHPMSETVALPKHVSVPLKGRNRIKQILESNHYIRVTCSTDGLIYSTSGPSLKERAKYGSGLTSKGPQNSGTNEDITRDESGYGSLINESKPHSSNQNSPALLRAIIPTDIKITGNADGVVIINTLTLGRQKRPLDKSKLKTFQQKQQDIYQHPELLPLRTDVTLV